MKRSVLLSLVAGTMLSIAGPALAVPVMVAGWDFSQYAFDGFLSLNGADLTGGDTLDANYSDRDPTFGAGAESAAFGTMYLNGQFGSTTTPLDFSDWFVPSAAAGGSLVSNPSPGTGVPFDTFGVLTAEGQTFTNPFVMTALAAATVVFEADLMSTNEIGSGWTLTFAGKTNTGAAGVTVQVSTDGVSFVNAGVANLTNVDTAFTFNIGAGPSAKAYARLVFTDPAVGQGAFLDNLSISAADVQLPEPSTAALLVAGLLGLARFGRSRD